MIKGIFGLFVSKLKEYSNTKINIGLSLIAYIYLEYDIVNFQAYVSPTHVHLVPCLRAIYYAVYLHLPDLIGPWVC